jgi:molecular chaperone DnaK
VTFDIDANGILNVTAKDTATNKDQKITITSSSGLSKEEVDRMAKEADAHASEDKAKRDEIEARNALDNMAYNVEKMLKENGDKVAGEDKSNVEAALAEAKKTLEGAPSVAELNAAREKLTTASHKLAEAMYKANSAAGAPPVDGAGSANGASSNGASGGAKHDEGVIDAEYVDVEDKK